MYRVSDNAEKIKYRVVWAVELFADDPEDAALKAREYQLEPEGLHTLFNVYLYNDLKGKPVLVETDEKMEQARVH